MITVGIICFIAGCAVGGKLTMWIVNTIIELDMKNGQAFIFRKGKWFPHNPRDGYAQFAREK